MCVGGGGGGGGGRVEEGCKINAESQMNLPKLP